MEVITLSHGSGGEDTHKLIEDIFYKYFKSDILLQKGDGGILGKLQGEIVATTDSFVVDPIFFPGGDIGKLSVCGTVNDLAVMGATPLFITVGFIIEEGLLIKDLEKVVKSMSETINEVGVKVVAGDTKVVEKGRGHKIYINTTGIGVIGSDTYKVSGEGIRHGDKIIISGTIGDHGMAIMSQREFLGVDGDIKSDCACLNFLIKDILETSKSIRIMRDPTRGGLATTLKEIVELSNKSILINEDDIPVNEDVRNFSDMLGFDPLYVANEGKIVLIVESKDAESVVDKMRKNCLGKDSKIIGEVIDDNRNKLYLKTSIGAIRVLHMAQGEMLPRIC